MSDTKWTEEGRLDFAYSFGVVSGVMGDSEWAKFHIEKIRDYVLQLERALSNLREG